MGVQGGKEEKEEEEEALRLQDLSIWSLGPKAFMYEALKGF